MLLLCPRRILFTVAVTALRARLLPAEHINSRACNCHATVGNATSITQACKLTFQLLSVLAKTVYLSRSNMLPDPISVDAPVLWYRWLLTQDIFVIKNDTVQVHSERTMILIHPVQLNYLLQNSVKTRLMIFYSMISYLFRYFIIVLVN